MMLNCYPISHKVEIINGSGYFYRYEVRDLEYDMSTSCASSSFVLVAFSNSYQESIFERMLRPMHSVVITN